MTPYEIPLSPEPQTFSIVLAGVERKLRVQWNKYGNCWTLDIMGAAGEPILSGVPIVTGTDLLGQYEHLGLGGHLVAQTDYDLDAVPSFNNLGVLGRLYFLVE